MPWADCSSLGKLYQNFQNRKRENDPWWSAQIFPRRERSNCFRLSFTQEPQTCLELYQGPFLTLHCWLFPQKSFLSPPLDSPPTTHQNTPSILVVMTRITLVPLSLSGFYLMMLTKKNQKTKQPKNQQTKKKQTKKGSIKENKDFFCDQQPCAFARVKGYAISNIKFCCSCQPGSMWHPSKWKAERRRRQGKLKAVLQIRRCIRSWLLELANVITRSSAGSRRQTQNSLSNDSLMHEITCLEPSRSQFPSLSVIRAPHTL